MLNACSINKVILMGRLTADPELRQMPSGSASCRFTVACDRGVNPNTNERNTDFINVTAFDKNAEFVSRYFNKGRLILVEGNLKTGSYEDRNHPDVRHYTTDVIAERISFGETKGSSGGTGGYDNRQQGGYQQGGYNNNSGYNNNGGYNNNNNYQQPQQNSVAVSDLSDFTEVISDSELPF
ncbi:MAG: single-stranded DNA-binding protein [Ruminococcus sp.]|nr:single-stranded DNA-binding protein [Ruminococcus sp.]